MFFFNKKLSVSILFFYIIIYCIIATVGVRVRATDVSFLGCLKIASWLSILCLVKEFFKAVIVVWAIGRYCKLSSLVFTPHHLVRSSNIN